MSDEIESLVELYLTRGGKVFVCPQYDVPYDKEARNGGACPDFVALDFEKNEVVVVEVTAAADLHGLFGKIKERESRWFIPIRRRLLADLVITEKWQVIRFLGFVRRANVDKANEFFSRHKDVHFHPLEDAVFSFAYWEERKSQGLPGGGVASPSDS